MRSTCFVWLAALSCACAVAQAPNSEVERHIAAARAAPGGYTALFERICPLPNAPPTIAATAGAQPATPPRESWHAEPVKVFDNLYFVGMTEFSAWAVTTTAGIIVIDPLFDYSVEDEIVEGLRKLGFDPSDIEYVLVSHGHLDHVGGAKLLQERFGARVLLTAADWDLLERDNPPWKPRRDMEIADGQKLTLGDTTLTIYHTPGHTLGTVSTLIPLRDGANRHVAALWGGTAFNFAPDAARYRAYADSAIRFRELAASAGADVMLSNHTVYDGTKQKLPALAARAPGAPHPYVVGTQSVRGYLTVANECALATLAGVQ
jgi:metallo-beta-lactamase class B